MRLAQLLLTCLYLGHLAVQRLSPFLVLLCLLPAAPGHAGQPLAVWLKASRPTIQVETGEDLPLPPVPNFGLLPGQSLHAVLRTSLGSLDCVLATEGAPNSVKAFVDLARGTLAWRNPRTGSSETHPLYDGTLFHRVVPGFLIQGGDPTGTGTGGPGFSMPDEIGTDATFDRAGILGLANRGPNTNGSQFFVTDGPAHHLNGRYTRLGACADIEVIERIARVPRGQRDRPVKAVVLRSVEIVARAK